MTSKKRLRLIHSLLLLIALAACTPQARPASTGSTPLAASALVKGYGISPQGFPADYSRFPDFLQEVGSLPHGGVMFNGAWLDLTGQQAPGAIPAVAVTVVEQASQFSYTPIIVFGWRSEETVHLSVPENPAPNWTNAEAKALFKRMLVDFATNYHPPYLFLGNENEAYYLSNPEDYARWVAFYNEAYAAIKAVSPETQVGPVFQYERLSGQGAFSQWTTPLWAALEAHDLRRVDVLGLTLYPFLGVATPEEVPDAYLSPLLERIGSKPLAITETGWPAESDGMQTPWEASSSAQLRFIETLDRILESADVNILNWLHLYQMSPQPEGSAATWFASISLRDAEGNKRAVYEAWAGFLP